MAAALGMAIGIVVFMAGWCWLPPVAAPAPEPARVTWTDARARRRILAILLASLSAGLLSRLDWPEFCVQGIGMLALTASFVLLQGLLLIATSGALRRYAGMV